MKYANIYAKCSVAQTDTQSLKMKWMVNSTLKVQMNSTSLKAIKIIGPRIYLHKKGRKQTKPALNNFARSILLVSHFTRLFEYNTVRAKRQVGRTTKKLLTIRTKGETLEISSQLDAIFSTALVHSEHGSFSLVPKIDARPFIDSYRTHLHFDDIEYTALARSRHKNRNEIGTYASLPRSPSIAILEADGVCSGIAQRNNHAVMILVPSDHYYSMQNYDYDPSPK